MKSIPLTRGLVALVDDADYSWLSQDSWCAICTAPGRYYAATSGPGGETVLMHRAILPGVPEVDHRDRNTLNNQRENLRPATHSQNLHNARKPRHNTSGFKGVHWARHCGKWRTQIRIGEGKRYSIGYFSNKIDAARAYDKEAIQRFGEFACVNFPINSKQQTNKKEN
jgi:hypothetical protein